MEHNVQNTWSEQLVAATALTGMIARRKVRSQEGFVGVPSGKVCGSGQVNGRDRSKEIDKQVEQVVQGAAN
jgi:hypothetical protein